MVASSMILAALGGDFADVSAINFEGALAAALAYRSPNRIDAAIDDGDPLLGYRLDHTARRFAAAGGGVKRNDADGVHFARELEYVRAQELATKYPVQNAFRLFPTRGDIPLGARTFTIRRGSETGAAAVYRQGARVPLVNVTRDEETRPIRYVAVAWSENYFDALASNYAGTNVRGRKIAAATNAINNKLNELAWYGSVEHKIRGILDFPYLDKAVSAVAFDGSATPDAVIAELNRWAHRAHNNSSQVFMSDSLALSPRVHAYLASTPRSSTSDTSILKWWLDNNGMIRRVVMAHELQAAGPSGTDACLFFRSDASSVAIELVGGVSMLPIQRDQFDDVQIMFQGFGGVSMEDAGNNVLVFVTGPTV